MVIVIAKIIIISLFIFFTFKSISNILEGLGFTRAWAYLQLITCLPCISFWSALVLSGPWSAMTSYVAFSLITKWIHL